MNYTNGQGLRNVLRKMFKFTVQKPLDVRTKFYTADVRPVPSRPVPPAHCLDSSVHASHFELNRTVN